MSQLLALVAIKGEEPANAMTLLSRAGYSSAEISALLGMSKDAVRMMLSRRTKVKKPIKKANGA
jgi:hypothetical protein